MLQLAVPGMLCELLVEDRLGGGGDEEVGNGHRHVNS